MKERDVELKVGAMVLGSLAILAVFFFVLGNFNFGSGYTLHVDYNFSGNIRAGAPVKVSGIKVGTVEEVSLMGGKLDERTGRRVQVRLQIWVENRVKDTIRADAEFFINTSGILGEKYLEIVPGSYEQPPLGEDAYVVGIDPPRTDLVIARMYQFLDTVTGVLDDNQDVIRGLLHDSAGAIRGVNRVLNDNHDTLGDLLQSADRFADEGAHMLSEVRTGIGDPRIIRRTLVDLDRGLVRADSTMEQLTPKIAALADEGARVTGLVTDDRIGQLLGTAADARRILTKTGNVLDSALVLLVNLGEGKGTAGRMLARDDLYADIKELVVDLKRHPWKLIWKE